MSGLVNPQFSATCVEASAPKVIGSLFFAPVSQTYLEQTVAGEKTQNIVEQILHVPAPQILKQIDESVDIPAPSSVNESTSPVCNSAHQEQIAVDPESVEHVQVIKDVTPAPAVTSFSTSFRDRQVLLVVYDTPSP